MVYFEVDLRLPLLPLIFLVSKFFHLTLAPKMIAYIISTPSNETQYLVNNPAIPHVVAIIASIYLPISGKFIVGIPNPVRFKRGCFSAPLAILLLCSLFLPHANFWPVFILVLAVSPCLDFLFDFGIRRLSRPYRIQEGEGYDEESLQGEIEMVDIGMNSEHDQEDSVEVLVE